MPSRRCHPLAALCCAVQGTDCFMLYGNPPWSGSARLAAMALCRSSSSAPCPLLLAPPSSGHCSHSPSALPLFPPPDPLGFRLIKFPPCDMFEAHQCVLIQYKCMLYMRVLAPKLLNHSSETMVKATMSCLPVACCPLNSAAVNMSFSVETRTCFNHAGHVSRGTGCVLGRQPANEARSRRM